MKVIGNTIPVFSMAMAALLSAGLPVECRTLDGKMAESKQTTTSGDRW
jgi:hypothetical protein